MSTHRAGSTATSISWPRESMLSLAKVSLCGDSSPICEPVITDMQPLSFVAGLKATQAVSTS